MSELDAVRAYRKWAEGVPRRNIFGVDDVELSVRLADAAIEALVDIIEMQHRVYEAASMDAIQRGEQAEAEVEEFKAYCEEWRETTNLIAAERDEQKAEVEKLRWMLEQAYADWVDGESREDWLADLARRWEKR